MKKNILLIAALVLFATGALTLNNLRAQTAPTGAGQPVSPPPGNPGGRPGGPPGFRRGPGANNYHGIANALKRVKADLEKSKDDFDGHRQSAIDACEKAAQDLEAVSVAAQASAKAAAAKAAAAAASAPATAPAAPAAPAAASPAPNQ